MRIYPHREERPISSGVGDARFYGTAVIAAIDIFQRREIQSAVVRYENSFIFLDEVREEVA